MHRDARASVGNLCYHVIYDGDGQDIASQFSADANENGIPDECEEENRAAGGTDQASRVVLDPGDSGGTDDSPETGGQNAGGDETINRDGSLTDESMSDATGPLPDGRGSDQSSETDGALRGTLDKDAAWMTLFEWAAAEDDSRGRGRPGSLR